MGTTLQTRRARRRALRVAALSLVGAVGLLLWARLKLVTDTPRMVYADPPAGSKDRPGGMHGEAPAPTD